MDVDSFLISETKNQGYDLTTKDGQIALIRYTRAWELGKRFTDANSVAVYMDTHSCEELIKEAGYLLDPRNTYYRDVPVQIGSEVISAEGISIRMEKLLSIYFNEKKLSPMEFYYYFEKIHPFIDGNGRVGKLVYNILNGTWANPIQPMEMSTIEWYLNRNRNRNR